MVREHVLMLLWGTTMCLSRTKRDVLQWNWTTDKRFSSKSVYHQWEEIGHSRNQLLGSLWKNLCPPKVEIFSWLAIQDRALTRSELFSRNIIQEGQTVSCPLCSLHLETPDHLFLHCIFSWNIWSLILDWWHVPWVCPNSLANLAIWWFDSGFRNLEKNIWEVSFYATLWSLWLARNDLVFNNANLSVEVVGELVKTRVAMWMKTKFGIKIYSVEEFKLFLDVQIRAYPTEDVKADMDRAIVIFDSNAPANQCVFSYAKADVDLKGGHAYQF
ncbi:uncharacterized protein LOC131328437 [Rhododendron vialii]|uniref:uncharacterized protein LOC131328437 n=1 Tax=Rhododendron vialii TaxID=182163 RepID=UPI00265EE9B1|nr:uncharacterized protein LOC131328437 [Rhododendron vialii]